jgi:hypothetical protein
VTRTMGVPVGVALYFKINSEPYPVIPMAIEEPSVIAAVSGAAKTISSFGGGFFATLPKQNITIAQIQLLDICLDDMEKVVQRVSWSFICYARSYKGTLQLTSILRSPPTSPLLLIVQTRFVRVWCGEEEAWWT